MKKIFHLFLVFFRFGQKKRFLTQNVTVYLYKNNYE